jgi:hypothetical protein
MARDHGQILPTAAGATRGRRPRSHPTGDRRPRVELDDLLCISAAMAVHFSDPVRESARIATVGTAIALTREMGTILDAWVEDSLREFRAEESVSTLESTSRALHMVMANYADALTESADRIRQLMSVVLVEQDAPVAPTASASLRTGLPPSNATTTPNADECRDDDMG